MLAGDAAGFADPFHGEGLSHAILSGKLAAAAVIDTIKNGQDPALAASRYIRACERHIRGNLKVALRMAKALDSHPGLFLRIFFDHPNALDRYLDIPSGRTDYRQFQRWLRQNPRTCFRIVPRTSLLDLTVVNLNSGS
jgi:flavin-dependent dehydrogenase